MIAIGTGCSTDETGRVEDSVMQRLSSQYAEFELVRLVNGMQYPWSIAFLPDGRMLVTERLVTEHSGRLNIVDGEKIIEVSGVPDILAVRQGGLMEVSIHPDFEQNGWVYLTYSKPNDDGETATALARGRLEGQSLVDVQDLFIQDRYSSPGRHYGSRIAWTLDGKLLMSVGDRGADPPRAQDLSDHAGKLLRLNDDGSVPADNPFVNDPDAHSEIYSYGHRNIQGLIVDPQTGEIWATEHGPRGGDELNRIEPGNNYGWPVATRGFSYGTQEEFAHFVSRDYEGATPPFHVFFPSPYAPSGLTASIGLPVNV